MTKGKRLNTFMDQEDLIPDSRVDTPPEVWPLSPLNPSRMIMMIVRFIAMEQVKEWELQFSEKYSFVGKLLRPGEEPTSYSDEDDEEEEETEEQKKAVKKDN